MQRGKSNEDIACIITGKGGAEPPFFVQFPPVSCNISPRWEYILTKGKFVRISAVSAIFAISARWDSADIAYMRIYHSSIARTFLFRSAITSHGRVA